MAAWKKVIVSGSNISELVNDTGYITGVSLNLTGSTGTDSVDLLNDSLTLSGSGGFTLAVTDNKIALVAPQALTTTSAVEFGSVTATGGISVGDGITFTNDSNAQSIVKENGDLNITVAGLLDITTTGGNSAQINSVTIDENGNVVVPGDLYVNGSQTNINTTNLDITDAYILLRSGSGGAAGDSGIIFGGSDAVAQSGSLLFWDSSYNGGDGRLALQGRVGAQIIGDQTPDYHYVAVYEGNATNAAGVQVDHVGNMRIESGDIFIYV